MTRDERGPRRGPRRRTGPASVAQGSERELILVARPGAGLRARGERVRSLAGARVRGIERLLREEGATVSPLFGATEERVLRAAARSRAPGAERMALFYRVWARDERLEALAARLAGEPGVAGAYVKPPTELPVLREYVLPVPTGAPEVTPDSTARQGYLGPAPRGIHARFAWTRPGGSGTDVRIVDVEGDWRFTHEDLAENQGGLVAGTPAGTLAWRDHGTAVLGELGGDRNAFGVTGICPEANLQAVSIHGLGTAAAIRTAADVLRAGDVLLVELHRPGPRHGFAARPDMRGYVAIEWWPDDLAAIQYATGLGVVVVEAAGNGAEDLDDALHDAPAPGFPQSWTNPFRRQEDSGAILVGAGAPPPGTHGRSHGPDRARLGFSNHGSAVDAQGWGLEVTTCGYGDLQGGADEDRWYTDVFAGTSSASAMVAGAVGALQGGLRGASRSPLTPAEARALLRATGSRQRGAPGRPATQRIGNRPDLRQAFLRLGIAGRVLAGRGRAKPARSPGTRARSGP